MDGPTDPGTLMVLRRVRPTRNVVAPNRTSFAKALRQRGLLARGESLPTHTAGWAPSPELWLAGHSIYETHLRRVAMEQVFAVLRGDHAANELNPA